MKRILPFLYFIIFSVLAFILVFNCEWENIKKLPDIDEPTPEVTVQPNLDSFTACLPEAKVETLSDVFSDYIYIPVDEDAQDALEVDYGWVMDVTILDYTPKDLMCNPKFAYILYSIRDYINTTATSETITNMLGNYLYDYLEEGKAMEEIYEMVIDALYTLDAFEMYCIGGWISEAMIYLDDAAVSSSWISVLLNVMLYDDDEPSDSVKASFAKELAETIDPIISLTYEEILTILDNLSAPISTFLYNLKESVEINGEPQLLKLMRRSQTHIPTDDELREALDELTENYRSRYIAPVAGFICDFLDSLPEELRTQIAASITPDLFLPIIFEYFELGECN